MIILILIVSNLDKVARKQKLNEPFVEKEKKKKKLILLGGYSSSRKVGQNEEESRN
jgi:hypothetical protein